LSLCSVNAASARGGSRSGSTACCWLAAALLSATVTYAADPPRLSAEALGPHRVRLLWSAPAGPVSGFQVWRNGQLLATLAPSAGVLLDEGLAARTLYRYEVAAIGGPRAVAALVTGPEIEAAALASGRFDVVIYGATPGGIAAAVTLGRRGRRVALVEPTPAIGGMLSGGLGRTDYGNIHALGGPFAAFMTAVDQYYASHYPADSPNQTLKRGGLYFEPHVAREILLGWLASVPSVTLYRDCPLAGATVEGGRLTAVIVDDTRRRLRRTLRAEVFIDAGYEGDLAAAAGCRYRLGRESHDEYGEDHAGKLWWDVWKTRTELVEGTGDSHVQAYNYRLCLTREPADRQPVPRPPYGSYHRETYLGLLPDIAKGRLKALTDILSILPLPNGKFDANNHPQGNPSSDLIGGADAWPRATTEQRLELAQQHRDHILGLLYFLQHDPAVPESLRADAAAWGLAADEFPEEAGWPSQIYVREGRRVLGDDTLTEHDTAPAPGGERPPLKADAIAVGSYPCDSHATGGRNPDHPDWLEGFFYLSSGHTKPYGIPYGILLPQGVEGLLVCGHPCRVWQPAHGAGLHEPRPGCRDGGRSGPDPPPAAARPADHPSAGRAAGPGPGADGVFRPGCQDAGLGRVQPLGRLGRLPVLQRPARGRADGGRLDRLAGPRALAGLSGRRPPPAAGDRGGHRAPRPGRVGWQGHGLAGAAQPGPGHGGPLAGHRGAPFGRRVNQQEPAAGRRTAAPGA